MSAGRWAQEDCALLCCRGWGCGPLLGLKAGRLPVRAVRGVGVARSRSGLRSSSRGARRAQARRGQGPRAAAGVFFVVTSPLVSRPTSYCPLPARRDFRPERPGGLACRCPRTHPSPSTAPALPPPKHCQSAHQALTAPSPSSIAHHLASTSAAENSSPSPGRRPRWPRRR